MTHAKPTKSFQQIKAQLGRTFHRGDRVTCAGRPGTIARGTYPHVRVKFDGRAIAVPCNPLELQVESSSPSERIRPLGLMRNHEARTKDAHV